MRRTGWLLLATLAACGGSTSGAGTPDALPDTGLADAADAVPEAAADDGDTVVRPDAADVADVADVLDAADAADDADVADVADAADADAPDVTGPVDRTMGFRPLFGDLHGYNLILDPGFSVRMGGLGTWDVSAASLTGSGPAWAPLTLSDAPSGVAVPCVRIADGGGGAVHAQLNLLAQTAGGPGPFRLRAWISTLDPAASATLAGAHVGILSGIDQTATEVSEAKTVVIGGRTWHLWDGVVDPTLLLGAYVHVWFEPGPKTWLVQAPELAPVALEAAGDPVPRLLHLPRPMTAAERDLVARYASRPRLSVPAGHPALSD